MRQIEKEVILCALRHYGNNYTDAAKGLGIARPTFYRRVDKLASDD